MGKVLKISQIRAMDEIELERKLGEFREELMMLYSAQTGGGLQDNPAKAKTLRRQIAQILTIINERKREEEWYEYEEEEL